MREELFDQIVLVTDGPGDVPRELGVLFKALLHGPAESLATAWNQVVTKALDSLGGSLPGFLMV